MTSRLTRQRKTFGRMMILRLTVSMMSSAAGNAPWVISLPSDDGMCRTDTFTAKVRTLRTIRPHAMAILRCSARSLGLAGVSDLTKERGRRPATAVFMGG